jgi:hypothetical protein
MFFNNIRQKEIIFILISEKIWFWFLFNEINLIFFLRLALTYVDISVTQHLNYVSVGHNWEHSILLVETTILLELQIRIRPFGPRIVIRKWLKPPEIHLKLDTNYCPIYTHFSSEPILWAKQSRDLYFTSTPKTTIHMVLINNFYGAVHYLYLRLYSK